MKLEKYKQKIREIRFLEVVIGFERIKMEKKKMKTVLDWQVSQIVKKIQKFLELASYYQWFVKDFKKISRPLYELARKTVIMKLNSDKKIRMEINVYNYIMDRVLLRENENKK